MRQLALDAPAKLNLGLEILGRCEGYHHLETVFQTLDLADQVTLTQEDGSQTRCTADDPFLDCGPANLAVRAAACLRPFLPGLGGLHIHLAKRIPIGGGLGGGSSDAAAVLRGLPRLAGVAVPSETLRDLALGLGSDVPFFLVGGTAHAVGRGEVLCPLPDLSDRTMTLLFPGFGCPTAAVFTALTEAERGPREPLGAAAWQRWLTGPSTTWTANRLTAAALRVRPELASLFAHLEAAGAAWGMSGSGSTCYVLGEIDPPPGVRRLVTRLRPRAQLDGPTA